MAGYSMRGFATRERDLTPESVDCLLIKCNRANRSPEEILMRIPVLAILAIGTMSAAGPAQAQTYGSDYPVCLHVYGPITYYECRYTSIPQCNLSASGRPAQCVLNPYAAHANHDRPAPRRRGVY
jgi:Protein of unknown function (DUF3551)